MAQFAVNALLRWSIVVIAIALTACAGVGPTLSVSQQEAEDILRPERLFGDQLESYALPEEDLFALSDEMKAWADAQVPDYLQQSDKAVALQRALLMAGGLGLEYNPYVTATAQRAFDTQSGNCVTFTALYYSLAKYLGVKAYINEVDVPATWDLKGQRTYVFFRHVNSKVKLPNGEAIVVDLDMDNYHPKYPQRKISEDDLRVQYYNNRAMEVLAEGDTRAAFAHLKRALEIDDEAAFVWSNLGILYRREKKLRAAEVAFRKALVEDPRASTAASNLGRLYRQLQEDEKAEQFERLASYYRYRNPYYQYHLAEQALAEGQLDEAEALVRKAIRSFDSEARFYQLQSRIYRAQGDAAKAREAQQLADNLKPERDASGARSWERGRSAYGDSRVRVY